MKKIITIVLMVSLFFSFPIFSLADTASSTNNGADLLFSLGCIDSETADRLNGEKEITRGELADVIAQIAKLEEAFTKSFSDVDPDHLHAKAISAVSRYHIMKGDDTGAFHPDRPATEMEALAVLLRLLGYEDYISYQGGYPVGYYTTARSLKIMNGIDKISTTDALTGATLSVLLKNFIEEPIYQTVTIGEQTIIKDQSDRTFLSLYYGIDKVKGVMTGNTGTLLDRVAENDGIIIGAKLLRTQSQEYDRYLGQEVEAYFDRETEKPIVVSPTKRNKLTVISASDIISRDGSRLIYEAGGREKTFVFPADAYIIYNQRAADFSYELFDIASGSITLIDNDGNGSADVVSILSYETVIIDSVDSVEMQIGFKYAAGSIGKDVLEETTIYDENGITDITWLHEWDALDLMKSENGEIIAIYCGGKVESKIPVEINEDGKKSKLVFQDGTDAYIHPNALNRFQGIELQKSYLFSSDMFGSLVAFTTDNADKIGVVLGINAEESVFDTAVKVKMFTENSELVVKTLSDKFTFDKTSYRLSKDQDRTNLRKALLDLTGKLIEFHTNQEGNISEIKTMEILFDGTGQIYGNQYSNCVTTADTTVFFRKDALAFYVPEDLSTVNRQNLRIANTTKLGVPERALTAYRRESNSDPEADAVKLTVASNGSDFITMGDYDQPSLIEKKIRMYNQDQETFCTKLVYWYNGNQRTALIEEEKIADEVEPGDVAYVGLDNNGLVAGFIKFYDYSEDKLTGNYVPGAFRAKHRRQIGYIYQTYNNLYTLTTEDISAAADPAALNTETHRYPNSGYVFDIAKGTVKRAVRGSFVSYMDSAEKYSKVFVFSTYSVDYMGVVYAR